MNTTFTTDLHILCQELIVKNLQLLVEVALYFSKGIPCPKEELACVTYHELAITHPKIRYTIIYTHIHVHIIIMDLTPITRGIFLILNIITPYALNVPNLHTYMWCFIQ